MKLAPSLALPRSSWGHRKVDPSPSRFRSAISNGSVILHRVDHRTAWMRRYRDLIADQLSDLGGARHASEAKKVLVRRSAMLVLQLELLEKRFAENEGGQASSADLETYQRVTNTLRRTLEVLGLDRRPVDITPRNDPTARVVAAIEASYATR